LAHLAGLTQLRRLFLENTEVTDMGLEQLGRLTQLQDIYLLYCEFITDAGLKHLAGLTQLRELLIDARKVTNAGRKKLQQALPNCRIH
jgi:hypothetical protein